MGGGGGGEAGDAALPWVYVPRRGDGVEKILLTLEEHYPRQALLKAIPELLRSGGKLWPPCYGWLPVSTSSSFQDKAPPFLLNLATCSDTIKLPSLETLPNCDPAEMKWFLLSSPPTDAKCRVFLVYRVNKNPRTLSYSEIAYCKPGDQLWTVHDTREDFSRFDPVDNAPRTLHSVGVFQGKLYAEVTAFPSKLLVISVDSVANPLQISPLKVKYEEHTTFPPALILGQSWIGESMGELLQVFCYLYGTPCQTYSIRVFKFDFSKKAWARMRSLKDRTLFLNYSGISSCSTAAKPRIRAWDDIFFFTRPQDQRLHSFNVEEDSFSVYVPRYTRKSPSHSPTLVTPPPPTRDADESYSNKNIQEAIKDKLGKRAKGCVVNWEALLDNCELADDIALPWFIFIKSDEDICNLIDPARGDEFQVKMSNFLLESRIVGSKNGILLMQKHKQICWVNPFTGLAGQYPLEYINDLIGIEFSTAPTSPCCVTVAITRGVVFYIIQGEGQWHHVPIFNFIPHGNPVFLDERFYFIGVNGELAIFDSPFSLLRVLERPESPCNSFEQCFLARCDGQLLSVFLCHIGNCIRVFKLDHSTMTWIEVESLENRSLFISHSWCFSTMPKLPGMKNKIFLSRYHGEKQSIIFYSLETKRFHYLDDCTDLMKGLCGSCERKNSCWIEPNRT